MRWQCINHRFIILVFSTWKYLNESKFIWRGPNESAEKAKRMHLHMYTSTLYKYVKHMARNKMVYTHDLLTAWNWLRWWKWSIVRSKLLILTEVFFPLPVWIYFWFWYYHYWWSLLFTLSYRNGAQWLKEFRSQGLNKFRNSSKKSLR